MSQDAPPQVFRLEAFLPAEIPAAALQARETAGHPSGGRPRYAWAEVFGYDGS